MGMPGTLPVLNRGVVEFGLRLGLATNCSISKRSAFARKNYFYPDLPKGYQITQHRFPLCENGYIDIELEGETKRVRILRIHMEEDAGKNIHDEKGQWSFVDFNRSGIPLLEIVSMPDIASTEEAVPYLRELRQILMYLGICDGNMEEGSFRCDANVSVKPSGSRVYGVRTEIKNMNSFRNIQKALDFEADRHIAILESGGAVKQETRLWNASLDRTEPMRSKEESHDYRYFPEPDLVPVEIDETWIGHVRDSLPELPSQVRQRLVERYGLPAYDAGVLTQTKALADYFEESVKNLDAPKDISNWIMTEVLRALGEQGIPITDFIVRPPMLAELVGLVRQGVISGSMAKEVFSETASSGRSPARIVGERGISQLSDERELREIARRIIADNPKEAEKYRAGKTGLLGFFVGQLMSATEGKANPKLASTIIKELLEA